MDAQQFAYWLQGFAELNEQPPTPAQWQSIREHLATVFVKVTPGAAGVAGAVAAKVLNDKRVPWPFPGQQPDIIC